MHSIILAASGVCFPLPSVRVFPCPSTSWRAPQVRPIICYSLFQTLSFPRSTITMYNCLVCFLVVFCHPCSPCIDSTQRQAEVCPAIPPGPSIVCGHKADLLKKHLSVKILFGGGVSNRQELSLCFRISILRQRSCLSVNNSFLLVNE